MTAAQAWHFDRGNEKFAGCRVWEPAALEALVELAAQHPELADPDWSKPHAVLLQGRSGDEFAMIRTDHPLYLRLLLATPKSFDARSARKALGLKLRKASAESGYDRYELQLISEQQARSAPFVGLFAELIRSFAQRCSGPGKLDAVAFRKLATRGEADQVKAALATDASLALDSKSLQEAAAKGHADVVRLLLSHGADANGSVPISRTLQNPQQSLRKLPLHQAAGELRQNAVADRKRHAGHLEVIRLLVAAGADLEARAMRQEVTPLLSATMGGSQATTDELLSLGARRSFYALAALGDVQGVQSRLKRSPKLARQSDANGMTALMYCAASRLGSDNPATAAALAQTAQLLIDNGADINVRRENYWSGEPPHHLNAVSFAALGNPAVLQVLLRAGIETELGGTSFTAIGQAVMARSEASLCTLLANQLGRSCDDPQCRGWNSTHWLAASAGVIDNAEEMAVWFDKKRILDPAASDAQGRTPVEIARSIGCDSFARFLARLAL